MGIFHTNTMSKSKSVGKLLDKFLGKVKGAGQKAGTAIRDFDDKYSEKIAGLYENANPVAQAAAYTMGERIRHSVERKSSLLITPSYRLH